MTRRDGQEFWAPISATVRLPPRMRLAPSERERLWKGLERFVNCGDSETDYRALGRSFREFWPVEILHFSVHETVVSKNLVIPAIAVPMVSPLSDVALDEQMQEELNEDEVVTLDWHPVCRRLFVFYRDTLQDIWTDKERRVWFCGGREEFLLGLSNRNEEAREAAKNDAFPIPPSCLPLELFESWREILRQFPTARPESRREIRVLWSYGDFSLVPGNDLERAFYLLFRQSWRARVCPRCKKFFVARRPKQTFCDTVCSAGSRLASKRKWWRRVGSKRRARQKEHGVSRKRKERKR